MAGDVSSSGSSAADREPVRPAVPQAPLALYRRYRPATFAEVKGQDHVTEPLRQALRSGRVHHAYLFSGPRGCGKTSSARILARSLNCEQGPTPDPCGTCSSCVALAPSGSGSIDVIEIDAASHGGIDDARDLRERAFYSPVAARYKIYIIDEAHMVTGAGFNALLKLVEEPPPHLKFVFATTEPEKVIATIKSRTHHYPFRLVPPAVLRELLEEILGAEGISYEPAVLPVVIRAGAGSVRDALSVLDQLIAGADESGLRYDQAITLLGYTDDALLDEMAEAFAARNGAAVFRAIDHVVEAGHDPRRFAADLLDRLRDLIVLAAVPDAAASGLLDVPQDRLDRMRKQSAGLGEERLVRAAETISAGLVEMRGAASPRLLLELMCAQVLLPAAASATVSLPGPGLSQSDPADLIARLERLERRVGGGLGADPQEAVARPSRPEPSRPEPSRTQPSEARPPGHRGSAADTGPGEERDHRAGPVAPRAAETGPGRPGPVASDAQGGGLDAGALRDRWSDVLEAVRNVRKVAWILLSNATVESVDGNVLTLAFLREGDAKGFGTSGCDQDIAEVLSGMFGARPVIRAIARPGGPNPGDARRDSRRPPGEGPGGSRSGEGLGDRSGEAGGSRSGGANPGGSGAGAAGSAGSGPANSGSGPGPGARNGQSTDSGSGPDAGSAGQGKPDSDPPAAAGAGDGSRPVGKRPGGRRSGSGPDAGDGRQPGDGRAAAHGREPAQGRKPAVGHSPVSVGGPAAVVSAIDDPRPLTDADSADGTDLVSGTDLIVRELGGRVIREVGED